MNAFVDLIKEYGQNEYDFSLRETQTYEIIEDEMCIRDRFLAGHAFARTNTQRY